MPTTDCMIVPLYTEKSLEPSIKRGKELDVFLVPLGMNWVQKRLQKKRGSKGTGFSPSTFYKCPYRRLHHYYGKSTYYSKSPQQLLIMMRITSKSTSTTMPSTCISARKSSNFSFSFSCCSQVAQVPKKKESSRCQRTIYRGKTRLRAVRTRPV